ncbi:MAG: flagellar protein FlaG [Thiobacillus sp.]|nr:flagellar protein FlaG [Thiobacillus sp.]
MIIQTTSHISQAAQPDTRANGAIPARAAADIPVRDIPRQPTAEELKNAVAVINETVRQSNQNLEFSVDSDTDRTVVRMVDTTTGELIRQFPSEAALAISRDIEHFQQGLLLKQEA